MKTYKYSDGREFRLSAIFLDDNDTWQTTIFWIESKTYQTFFWVEIDYLMPWEIKPVEVLKAEIKAEKVEKAMTKKPTIVRKKPEPPTPGLF